MKGAARPDTWMPLDIGDYLADTMHLDRGQHGAYILLIMAYWRRGHALPDDDTHLMQIAKADKRDWKALKPVLEPFFKVGDGVWWHKRIEEELATAEAVMEKNRKRTEAARAAKQEKEQGGQSNNYCNRGCDNDCNDQRNGDRNDGEPPNVTTSVTSTPIPLPNSVPNGTGGPPGADLAARLFGPCLAYLVSCDVPKKQARSLLGKWRKTHGDGEVIAAIDRAQAQAVSEPVSWLEATLKGEVYESPPDPMEIQRQAEADWEQQTEPDPPAFLVRQ